MLESAVDFYAVLGATLLIGPLVTYLLSRRSVMAQFWGIVLGLGLLGAIVVTLIQWGGSSFWHYYPG